MATVDWVSFLLGLLTGVVAIILSGFFGAAGKDLYAAVKKLLQPSKLKSTRAWAKFKVTDYPAGSCNWARDEKLETKIAGGYTYYLDSVTDSRVFRVVLVNGQETTEHLLVKPDAKRFAE